MKQLILAFFLLTGIVSKAQDVTPPSQPAANREVVGRWIEVERQILQANPNVSPEGSIYIFKEDLTFFRGHEVEGVILFAVSGTYVADTAGIEIKYYDFRPNMPTSTKPRRMTMKILSADEKEMKLEVRESRYNKYISTLRRQG